ncbi:MAG TPA: right-handed parallel beta-helix repeat-containing protein [Bdellovibrionota bacterium]|jgi:hypothetical protein|nr:right-handed parallel beta-helix repeat-containing protein [Bdellovibrionota bacterium]
MGNVFAKVSFCGVLVLGLATGCSVVISRSKVLSNRATFVQVETTDELGAVPAFQLSISDFTNKDLTYQYAVGTGTLGNDAKNLVTWTTLTSLSQITQALPAIDSRVSTYYINVRVKNKKGKISPDVVSQGWKVALKVEPLYTTHGTMWMKYIKNNGASTLESDGTACAGDFYPECMLAAPFMKASVTGRTTCDGLEITDNLAAMRWTCKVTGGVATLYSYGFAPQKGLRDVLAATEFLDMKVMLSGDVTNESLSAKWWSNPIQALPDNSAGTSALSLDSLTLPAHTILTLAESRASAGYEYNGANLGIVTLRGAILSYNGAANNVSLIGLDEDVTQVHVEGDFDCNAASGFDALSGVDVYDYAEYLTIRNVSVSNCVGSGMSLDFPYHLILEDIRAYSNGSRGITIYGMGPGRIANIEVANNTAIGLRVFDGEDQTTVIENIKAFNNGGNGVQLGYTYQGWVLNDVFTSGNGGDGFYCNGCWPIVARNITAINNAGYGARFEDITEAYISSIVAINNGLSGIYFASIDSSLIKHLASFGNAGTGIHEHDGFQEAGVFTEVIMAGQNTTANCNGTGSGTPNIDSGCNSDASFVSLAAGALDDTFVGIVGTSDSENASNANGSSAFASISDWFNFMNPLRVWAKGGASSVIDAAARGRCSSGTCEIFDFGLSRNDDVLRDRTYTGVAANPTFTDDQACPANLSGNVVNTWNPHVSLSISHLTHAVEINDDVVGNNNGFCESGEACLYTPNFGYYQGHGDYLSSSCEFQDGTITGVTMYRYPENGY